MQTGLLIPQFCRVHPMEARNLTMYRYAYLLADPPTGLGPELLDLNEPVKEALRRLTQARYGRVTQRGIEIVSLAARDAPIGMIRLLIGTDIPSWVDMAVRAASTALAHLEDTIT